MKSKQFWAGRGCAVALALLALGLTSAEAAPGKRVTITGGRPYRASAARPAPRHPMSPRSVKPPVVAKRRPSTWVAARPAPTTVRRTLVARATAPGKGRLWAQATPGDPVPTPSAPVAISPEVEPLMLRALAAYYVTDEAMLRSMRSNGWSFGDLATAGNMAVRSRRSFWTVANTYDQRRDWAVVAQDLNVPADDIYVAANSPRYAMVRPTLEEELRMMAPPPADTTLAAAPATVPPPPTAIAAPPPPVTTTTAPKASAAATPPPAVTPPDAAPLPQAAPVPPPPRVMTPVERVAASRLELAPREPEALLRRVVATYYALPSSTVRELESQGWTLNDILVAGNLAHRSEATFEEVTALHNAGNDWNTVAERIGVAAESLHQPTLPRRIMPVAPRVMEESSGSAGRSPRNGSDTRLSRSDRGSKPYDGRRAHR